MSEGSRSERYMRYSGLVSPQRLLNSNVLVLGVGAIGRQVALQLAAMGVGSVELCDFDTVEEANYGAQGYRPDQLGGLKANETRIDMEAINPEIDIYAHTKKFGPDFRISDYTAIFACVDCMTARKDLFDLCKENLVPIIDTRMSGLNAQAYFVNDENDGYEKYRTTLFSNEEAHPEPCTARSVLFTSNIIAGIAVSLWTTSLSRTPEYPYLRLSLADYTIDPIELEALEAPAVGISIETVQSLRESLDFYQWAAVSSDSPPPSPEPSEDAVRAELPSET